MCVKLFFILIYVLISRNQTYIYKYELISNKEKKHLYQKRTNNKQILNHQLWSLGNKHVITNAIGCEFDSYSRKQNIEYFYSIALVTRQSAVLSSTTEHTKSPEFGGK